MLHFHGNPISLKHWDSICGTDRYISEGERDVTSSVVTKWNVAGISAGHTTIPEVTSLSFAQQFSITAFLTFHKVESSSLTTGF